MNWEVIVKYLPQLAQGAILTLELVAIAVIAGLIRPSAGHVSVQEDGRILDRVALRDTLGMVAPDLSLYGELAALENLQFFARLFGHGNDGDLLGAEALEAVRGDGEELRVGGRRACGGPCAHVSTSPLYKVIVAHPRW